MTRKRLAQIALAVFAMGVMGLVAVPAWAAAGAGPVDLAAVTDETTTKTCEPGKYSHDCPRPTKTHTKPPTSTTTKPHPSTTTKTKTETETKTKTETKTETETKTKTVPVSVTTTTPTLPVTGSATTAVIVGGVALVLGGATLLGWLRRRREE